MKIHLNKVCIAAVVGAATTAGFGLQALPGQQPAANRSLQDPGLFGKHGEILQGDEDLDWTEIRDGLASHHAQGQFRALVLEGEIGLRLNPEFLKINTTLAYMNELAYARGKNNNRQLQFTAEPGWKTYNISAVSGGNQADECAGFLAYHAQNNILTIVMRGSIGNKWTGGDWVANRDSTNQPLILAQTPKLKQLNLVGHGHRGILTKYLSCRDLIMTKVDRILAGLPQEVRAQTRFYVTGHSQGAALASFLAPDLCRHLRNHLGEGFDNAKANQVQAWLLAAPLCLDPQAAAQVEQVVGAANILRQNTHYDVIPNLNLAWWGPLNLLPGRLYTSIGILLLQDSTEAMRQYYAEHPAHQNPDPGYDGWFYSPKAYIEANHMMIKGFDNRMVDQASKKVNEGLDRAYDQQQQKLRNQNQSWRNYFGWKVK